MTSLEVQLAEFQSTPEHAPTVSFDGPLLEAVEDVDFYYLGYQAHLIDTLGVDPKYIERLHILFTDKTLSSGPKASGGYLWPDIPPDDVERFDIEVKVVPGLGLLTASLAATDILVHESRHFADSVQGKYPRRTSRLGRLSVRTAYKITPWEIDARRAVRDFRRNPRNTNTTFVDLY